VAGPANPCRETIRSSGQHGTGVACIAVSWAAIGGYVAYAVHDLAKESAAAKAQKIANAYPVVLLKKIPGCALERGVSSGSRDFLGDLQATCRFADGESIEAISTSNPRANWNYGRNAKSDKIIVGDDFIVVYSGVHEWETDTYRYSVPPTSVATLLGGALH
jgi:hypothetical protein